MDYGIRKQINTTFEDAIGNTIEALGKEGFGVLTQINVKDTLKKKIDVDIGKYVILGACSPKHAHAAILEEIEIGLLLPCNVIVYEKEGKVYVSAINPEVAMSFVGNEVLVDVAKSVTEKLRRVIESL